MVEEKSSGPHRIRLNDRSSYQMCFVCGQRNPAGLKLWFDRKNGRVITEFKPRTEHQGYPGYLHGGLVGALLDETLSRAAMMQGGWVMTGRITTRYRRPAPVDQTLILSAEVVKSRRSGYKTRGEAKLRDGTLIAEAEAVFLPVPQALWDEVCRDYPDMETAFV